MGNEAKTLPATPAIEMERLNLLKEAFPTAEEDQLIRFLVARQMDPKAAGEMYKKYLAWRDSRKHVIFKKEIILENLHRNVAYIISIPKGFPDEASAGLRYVAANRSMFDHCPNAASEVPLVYVLARNHWPKKVKKAELVDFNVFLMDTLVKATYPSVCSDLIINLHGTTFANTDLALAKKLTPLYQDYFPERLRRAWVCGLGSALEGIWDIVKTQLDPRTQNRIVVLKKDDESKILAEYGKDITPVELGGAWEPKQDIFIDLIEAEFKEKKDKQKDKK